MTTKFKYAVRQVSKEVNPATNKIKYKFEFLRNGDPIKLADVPMPLMKEGKPVLDEDKKLQYTTKAVYRSLEMEFDPGTPRSSITAILKRQLLEMQIIDESHQADGPAKLDSVPDIGEITSDDLAGMDLDRLKKKGK